MLTAGTQLTKAVMSEWPHVDSDEKYRVLFRSIDTGFCIIEVLFDPAGRPVDYVFLDANPAFVAHTGLHDAIGKRILDLAPQHEKFWFETYGRIVRTGQPERFEHRADALGRWYSVYAFRYGPPEQHRVAILFDDIKERKWAEAELRESEERFRQFAEASSGAMWIRDAATLAMEYASPAIATIYGVEPGTLLGDVALWAAAIVPEDRDLALEHLERAQRGQAVAHEFRIHRPSDRTVRWIKNTAFPLRDANGSIKRIGGILEDVTEAKLAIEHQGVLLAELQHRVRNTMAIVRSIVTRTAERAENVREYADLMTGRLLALARVQALLTRAPNDNVSLKTLVRDELSAQAQHEGQYVLDGPDIALSPKAAEVLTLAVHELATNALKYGALSVSDGKVNVQWSTFEKQGSPWLDFNWVEEGAPEQPPEHKHRKRGFGIELIERRIPYELGGSGQVSIEAGGARCHLEFPLKAGASILATGAPMKIAR
jgi:PAS domain S-box-containing protein